MNKRSYRLWTALVFASSIFWAFWRWVPRVRVMRGARLTLSGRILRDVETWCPLDPALHDCNLTLEGSCPADAQRTIWLGVKVTVGNTIVTWPRDAVEYA